MDNTNARGWQAPMSKEKIPEKFDYFSALAAEQ